MASYNGYERDISSISLIVDDHRPLVSLCNSNCIFFYLIPKSILLVGFHSGIDNCICSMHSRQWVVVVWNRQSCSSIMVLVYAAPKLNSSLVTNVLFVQLEDVEGVLMRIELDPPPCILGIFCLNFHWILSVRSFKSLPFFS